VTFGTGEVDFCHYKTSFGTEQVIFLTGEVDSGS
jgi:hypothetical protein